MVRERWIKLIVISRSIAWCGERCSGTLLQVRATFSAPLPHLMWLTRLQSQARASMRARCATHFGAGESDALLVKHSETQRRQRRESRWVFAGKAPSLNAPRQRFPSAVFDQRAVRRRTQRCDRIKKRIDPGHRCSM